jgi:hypothetical protein
MNDVLDFLGIVRNLAQFYLWAMFLAAAAPVGRGLEEAEFRQSPPTGVRGAEGSLVRSCRDSLPRYPPRFSLCSPLARRALFVPGRGEGRRAPLTASG